MIVYSRYFQGMIEMTMILMLRLDVLKSGDAGVYGKISQDEFRPSAEGMDISHVQYERHLVCSRNSSLFVAMFVLLEGYPEQSK